MYEKEMIKAFSVSTPAYPWDLMDEGVDKFIDGAIEHIGANSVFSPICYYWEEASAFWWGGVMPHNKKIRRYFPEDGRFYVAPNLDFYKDTKIKPDRSKDPLLQGFESLAVLSEACKKRGMDMSVWFPVFKNPYLARKYPDCTPVDIFGGRMKHGLCPNHPDVIGYYLGTIKHIVRYYDISAIGLDKFGFEYWAGGCYGEGWYTNINNGQEWAPDIDPQFLLLNTPCFCEHCARQAKEWGYDWDKIKARIQVLADGCLKRDPAVTMRLGQKGFFKGEPGLARLLLEEQEVYQWCRFKIDSMVEVAKRIKTLLKTEAPCVSIGAGLDPSVGSNFQRFRHYGWMYGTSMRDLANVLDGISGSSGMSADEKYYMHMIDKEAVDQRCDFRGGDVHAVSPCSPDDVRAQIEMFDKVGSTSYCIFGYTWAPLENLHAARDMLKEIERRMVKEKRVVERVSGR